MHTSSLRLLLFFNLSASILSGTPVITTVMNAASNVDPSVPNSAIAPGSIFIVKGTGLGPAAISIAPAAFQTTSLSGTSVKITAGSASFDAPLYYTSATQIAALLPSSVAPDSTPKMITLTYNGQASPAVTFGVTCCSRCPTERHKFLFPTRRPGAGLIGRLHRKRPNPRVRFRPDLR